MSIISLSCICLCQRAHNERSESSKMRKSVFYDHVSSTEINNNNNSSSSSLLLSWMLLNILYMNNSYSCNWADMFRNTDVSLLWVKTEYFRSLFDCFEYKPLYVLLQIHPPFPWTHSDSIWGFHAICRPSCSSQWCFGPGSPAKRGFGCVFVFLPVRCELANVYIVLYIHKRFSAPSGQTGMGMELRHRALKITAVSFVCLLPSPLLGYHVKNTQTLHSATLYI